MTAVIVFFTLVTTTTAQKYLYNSASDVQNILFDNVSKRVFLGCTNEIIRLADNLEYLDQRLKTGPYLDNKDCYSEFGCTTKQLTNNTNKVLLVTSGLLIHCGSLFGGRCNASDLTTLKISDYESSNAPLTNSDFWVASSSGQTMALTESGLENSQALYVALEKGPRVGVLGDGFPFIASYYLDFTNSSTMFKRAPNAWTVLSKYISLKYMFSNTPFFYVVSQILNADDSPPIIARICLQDTGEYDYYSRQRYKSYVKLKWECVNTNEGSRVTYRTLEKVIVGKISVNLSNAIGGEKGDDVLIGLFYHKNSKTYALCPYLVKDMNRDFDTILPRNDKSKRCNHGIQDAEVDGIISKTPIGGEFKSDNITSILLFNIKDDNVLLAGTSNGNLIKIVLRDQLVPKSRELAIKTPILKMVPSKTYVYGISDKVAFGHPLGDCTNFTTCETCVGGGDPFCGWCLLESRCMQYSECEARMTSQLDPQSWINTLTKEGTCFNVQNIAPPFTKITEPTPVEGDAKLLVNALSSKSKAIFCDWVYHNVTKASSSAIIGDKKISCASPELPGDIVPRDQDNIMMDIWLKRQDKQTRFFKFVSNYPLYYCQNNKRCYNCTSSRFNCVWCKEDNRCVYSSQECGDKKQFAKEVAQCPALLGKEYTMESESDGEVVIEAKNLLTEGSYKCRIPTKSDVVETKATIKETNEIACSVPLERVEMSGVPRRINLVVTYNNVPILNPNNSAVLLVYKCQDIKDCSTCKALESRYQCGWCKQGDQCVPQRKCLAKYLEDGEQCSGSRIDGIYPTRGPVEGGTVLTITGRDLSIKFKDIKKITVANVNCRIISDNYVVSTRVCCITDPVDRSVSGIVEINSLNGNVATSRNEGREFYYQTGEILSVTPLVVIKSGGTIVTVSGNGLDMGSKKTVMLGKTPCDVISAGADIACKTRPVDNATDGVRISVKIDDSELLYKSTLSYIPVPNVTEVTPMNSIIEGGISIKLLGSRGFSAITSAQIYFFEDLLGNISRPASCLANSDDSILCETPQIIVGNDQIRDGGLVVKIKLILERSFTKTLQFAPFRIWPNPLINLDGDITLRTGSKLVVKGRYFGSVPGIKVYIQDVECQDLDVSDTLISCTVPDIFSSDNETDYEVAEEVKRRKRQSDDNSSNEDKKEEDKNNEQEVPVEIYLQLGSYKSEPVMATFIKEEKVKSNKMGMIILTAAIIFVVVLLSACLCFMYRRKTQQKKHFDHVMFTEMERIEQRLAEECKQVFTELQTDLEDLNSDFSPASIPYHSFDEYALRVLFPGSEDGYSVLQVSEEIEGYEDNLKAFNSLLRQDKFILSLVEMLDKQRQVTMRDKSNIAALITVSLMDDMAYTTHVLRSLLSKLISETAGGDAKRHKLLLRRSVHITEKFLSNWLTFNLHSFLLDAAGQPLYVLYRAIKQQIEKGPVDFITGNARYALHERNLLSKITDFERINVMVYLDDDPYLADTNYTPLKSSQVMLLSCDTISQVKAKIIDVMYRNVPDSLKPTPKDVDVELKNGSSSSLRLVDMLQTTQDGWKQLDTLGSLNIDEQAVLQCIPRQSPPPFMSHSGGAPSCNSLLREIESGRVWHLERDPDQDTEGKGISSVKTVPEVFLTRLSATKIPLQKFVDDIFDVIFTPNQGVTNLPPCVKYLLDLLDSEAERLQISDPEVIHTWKNNALPLRYWISIIKSPDVVFDVRKNNNIDSCLSVIAQTFLDATSFEDMTIDKNSQSSRLLYCKEIPRYKQHVREFYGEVQTCSPVSESEIEAAFNRNRDTTNMKKETALYQLFCYASRFSEEIRDSLCDKGYKDLAEQFMKIADNNTDV